MYLLDSDTLRLYQDQDANVLARIRRTPYADIWVSGITAEENVAGRLGQIQKVRSGKATGSLDDAYAGLHQTIALLAAFNLLAFGQTAEERYRTLMRECKRQNVRDMDTRLAAHALVSGMVVVTRNTRDFTRIAAVARDFRFEDWSTPDGAPVQTG